jgi:hypothetical protein
MHPCLVFQSVTSRPPSPPLPIPGAVRVSTCTFVLVTQVNWVQTCLVFPSAYSGAAAPLPRQYLHVCTSKAVSIRTFVPAKQACCALLPQRRPCSLCPKDLKQAGDRESSNLTHVFVANLRHASLADRSPETPEYRYSMSAARKVCQQLGKHVSKSLNIWVSSRHIFLANRSPNTPEDKHPPPSLSKMPNQRKFHCTIFTSWFQELGICISKMPNQRKFHCTIFTSWFQELGICIQDA